MLPQLLGSSCLHATSGLREETYPINFAELGARFAGLQVGFSALYGIHDGWATRPEAFQGRRSHVLRHFMYAQSPATEVSRRGHSTG